MTLSATWLNGNIGRASTTITVAVTATGTAGRLVLVVSSSPASGLTPFSVTGVSGLGATWAHRATMVCTDLIGLEIEEWYADLLSSWSSGTITVTLNSAPDAATVMAALITSSRNAAISFDTNGSMPTTFQSSVENSASVSTDSSAPYVIAAESSLRTGAVTAIPAAINNLLGSETQTAGSTNPNASVFYGGLPGQLASTATGFTSLQRFSVVIVDALSEAPPPKSANMLAVMGL